MAYGEGANWEGTVDVIDGVIFELQAESSPTVGVVRIPIADTDTPIEIAKNLATEWNARKPIEDVIAYWQTGSTLTAFFLTGALANEPHTITKMAATFDGKPRKEMQHKGDSVTSSKNGNTGLSVRRVSISIGFVASEETKMASDVERIDTKTEEDAKPVDKKPRDPAHAR